MKHLSGNWKYLFILQTKWNRILDTAKNGPDNKNGNDYGWQKIRNKGSEKGNRKFKYKG